MSKRRAALIAAIFMLAAHEARGETLADFARGASCLIGPNHIYKLAMATPGALALVNVERSDKVKKGDLIAELESGVERSQVEAARVRAATDVQIRFKKAVAAAAAAKAERLGKLRAAAIANQQSLDDAEAAANATKAEVEQAELDKTMAGFDLRRLEATLERRSLHAPANGVITAVDLHAGEYADPANPIATLTEIDPLKVDIYLPARAYPLIAAGDRARVTPKEPAGDPREAEVITKDPQIDASSGLFLVQLRLPNSDFSIPAGVRCDVAFAK